MTVTRNLIIVELKLLGRDPMTMTFALVFPAVLLLGLGFIPGFTDPEPDLGGLRTIDVYTPVVLLFTLVMTGISSFPHFLASYRHQGVLRRLRTTPVGPSRLLAAQLVAHLILALAATVLAVVVATVVHDVAVPASWSAVAVALLGSATALFTIGLLVGAVVPSVSATPIVTTLLWLPLMVLAGLWFPREFMPDLLRRISDLSPAGAGVDAVQSAWFGEGFATSSLAVLVLFAAVTGLVASRTFRWE